MTGLARVDERGSHLILIFSSLVLETLVSLNLESSPLQVRRYRP